MVSQREIYTYLEERIARIGLEEICDEILEKNEDVNMDDIYFVWMVYKKRNPDKNVDDYGMKRKRLDAQFRERVIKRWEKRCVISGVEMEECEVAHLKAFKDCDEKEKYDEWNGWVLSANLHKCFDKYIFSVNKEKEIEVHPSYQNARYTISKYHGQRVNLSDQHMKYMDLHYQHFLQNKK